MGHSLSLNPEFNVPWCIGGDFNEIRNINGRQGCPRRDRGMRDFNCFMEDMELVDSRYHLSKVYDSPTNAELDFIWKNVTPHRIQCFGWLVQLGRVKTAHYVYNLVFIHNHDEVMCNVLFSMSP